MGNWVLFTDDTVIYIEIENKEDRLTLSNDLDKIIKWYDDWNNNSIKN